MATNYYLRRVKPREVHDEYHIAKTSRGWRVYFQDSSEYSDDRLSPSYHSVDDIERLLQSGEYQISDENGNVWSPGRESVKKLKELCEWCGGEGFEGLEFGEYPDDEPPYDNVGKDDYRDPQGFVFSKKEFY